MPLLCRRGPSTLAREHVSRRVTRGANPVAMSVRAVLWDLDGTLTDSVRFVVDTANRVIEAHGGSPLPFESAVHTPASPKATISAMLSLLMSPMSRTCFSLRQPWS